MPYKWSHTGENDSLSLPAAMATFLAAKRWVCGLYSGHIRADPAAAVPASWNSRSLGGIAVSYGDGRRDLAGA